ncbi:hypothetical protein R1sor_010522 [Riccia sorocarpa]|uniref:NF-kappa-B inhibitor-like protein 1 n=1 Tax=Riccia sorocarpa TaxID=122646 RepID=A0ABD3I2D2_9MARC
MANLERSILNAAALGNVKLLRGFIDSYRQHITKQKRRIARRASREQGKNERRASRESRKRERQATQKSRRSQKYENPSREKVKKPYSDWERESPARVEKRQRYDARKGADSVSGSPNISDADSLQTEELKAAPSISDTIENISRLSVPSVVNVKDTRGFTPLHHACYSGSDDAVKYLLSEGAGVHFRDLRGNTPLHIAAKLKSESIVSILKEAGADMEAFNDDGQTPSEILDRNEKAEWAKFNTEKDQSWYDHLAGEVSEDEWWGESFADVPEPDSWESILESMAENYQSRSTYDDPYISHFGREKKPRKEKMPGKDRSEPANMEQKKNYPEKVNLQKDSTLLDSRNYQKRWREFSTSYNLCLSYSDIPFPVAEGKEETLAQVFIQEIDPPLQRDVLRKEILKWHPDKFLQKWGARLRGPDYDRIVARVNEISQALNILYKKVASSK